MKTKSLLSILPLSLASAMAFSQSIEVEVTNLTHGIHFTPILVSAHDDATHLFSAGMTASDELKAMAEGGDTGPLMAANAESVVDTDNLASGMLAPSVSTPVTAIETGVNTHLSIVAMMLPTNDGFIGLDGWEIPTEVGTYTVYLNGYDAGTEVNDEIINGGGAPGVLGIPGAPGMDAGTGATGVTDMESNTAVHIHRGNTGDTSLTGGISDVDSRIHRWLNPVAKVVVTVK
ncbi:MAG: spondin domain-containing protein [Bermanella sp.]